MVLKLGGEPTAGVIAIESEWGDVPSNWSVVFQVEDCDGVVAKARELGGAVIREPQTLPEVGRFAVLGDPWGAVFQVIDPAR